MLRTISRKKSPLTTVLFVHAACPWFIVGLIQKSSHSEPMQLCVRLCTRAHTGNTWPWAKSFGLTPGVLRGRHVALISAQHVCVPVGHVGESAVGLMFETIHLHEEPRGLSLSPSQEVYIPTFLPKDPTEARRGLGIFYAPSRSCHSWFTFGGSDGVSAPSPSSESNFSHLPLACTLHLSLSCQSTLFLVCVHTH